MVVFMLLSPAVGSVSGYAGGWVDSLRLEPTLTVAAFCRRLPDPDMERAFMALVGVIETKPSLEL